MCQEIQKPYAWVVQRMEPTFNAIKMNSGLKKKIHLKKKKNKTPDFWK